MKIDSALREFSERYDRAAMESIEKISRDHALIATKQPFPSFTLTEGFNTFIEFMTGFTKYTVESVNEETPVKTHAELVEGTKSYIAEKLFSSIDKEGEPLTMLYSEVPSFVEAYLSGVKRLTDLATKMQESMMEAGVSTEGVSSIGELMDSFMLRLHESFDPWMDKLLWASGYHTEKALAKPKTPTEKPVKPVFL